MFVACCTLLVVMGGAAVTSSRHESRHVGLQNIHVAAGVILVVLIVGLAIGLVRAAAVTRMGWIALAVAGVESGLGELRWLGWSDPVVGTLHAGLGALLFVAVAGICLLHPGSASLRWCAITDGPRCAF